LFVRLQTPENFLRRSLFSGFSVGLDGLRFGFFAGIFHPENVEVAQQFLISLLGRRLNFQLEKIAFGPRDDRTGLG